MSTSSLTAQSERVAVVATPPRQKRRTSQRPLRFATFLAPKLFSVYDFIVQRISTKLDWTIELIAGSSYRQLADMDAAFVCGLAYVQLSRTWPVEPLVAPVLQGDRYGGKPIYFSDVIARRDRPFRSFADLRGCSWSYNEPLSHSGYGITRYELARRGETCGFFGKVVKAGYHERSISLVRSGSVDASAIDSQVLAIALRDHPDLASELRIIDSFGPSTIQPLVVAPHLPERLRAEMLGVLAEMSNDPVARAGLAHALIERFVPVFDSSYDDIRYMMSRAESAGLLDCMLDESGVLASGCADQ
jgi:phosphonate transport system substrate-binding protein